MVHQYQCTICNISKQSIYIKHFVSPSVSVSRFVCPRGTNNLFLPRGQTFLTYRRGGDKHFSHTGGRGGQTFLTHRGGANIFYTQGGQTFFVGGGGSYDYVDEEIDVSEASFLVSEASKLSAGARIFSGP